MFCKVYRFVNYSTSTQLRELKINEILCACVQMSAFVMFRIMCNAVSSSKKTLGMDLCHRGEHKGFH